MQQVTRQEIFDQAAKKLRQDFSELYTIPHAGLKGGEAEELIRNFLRGHLPKRFDIGSGFIIDGYDKISKQTDVIVYDALNCPVYRASERAAIIPADNVAAVIEVKSRLDKEKLREAFANAQAVKGLSKTTPPNAPVLITCQTLCLLFAFETSLTLGKLAEHYADCIREFSLGRHIDVVFLLDKGLIMLAGKIPEGMAVQQGMGGWAPLMLEGFGGAHGEGAHIAVSATEIREGGLDLFLRFLLAHLIHFRGLVGHPGFWLKQGQPQMSLTYLTSITHEKDPKKRDEKLRRYAEQVIAEFGSPPVSPSADREPPKSAEAPAVIILPPSDLQRY